MREFLPLLPRPSRYIGIEEGAVHKDEQHIVLRFALAFPDTYEVGMSYLGQKILYTILNAKHDWWAERVMAPCRESADILREQHTPLCTLESDTPLANMHCIGFSITHELAYTNVLYMLDLAGIPLYTSQRGDDLETWPIILAGGGATLSAEPLAPFIDIMILGEGEESLVDVGELLVKARSQGWGRRHFLEEARHIAGIYIPSLFTLQEQEHGVSHCTPLFADYTKATRRIVTDINTADYPVQQVVPIGAVHNRLSLEIARGCTRGCRFCHAGMVYRPVRERSLDTIHTLLDACLAGTGFDEISYLSLSTGDFSALKTLFMRTVDQCAQEQISVSLPSLRVGSVDDSIMERMAGIRRTGATLAPEAGSQRLRNVINKGITEEELLLHVQKLIEHGWQQVKLYFMIGLPTECQEDLDAIVDICCKVRDAAGKGAPRLQITAAISPFVPKPFTPFQWEAQLPLGEIHNRIHYLRQAFKGQKCIKMRWHEPAMSHLEGILSRGDRRLAPVVEKVFRKGGIFSAWADSFSLEPWLEALQECGLTPTEYTGTRPLDKPLAWNHLEAGISTDFLHQERQRAFAEKNTADCRYHACRHCGACDTAVGTSRLHKTKTDEKITHILNLPQRDQEAHSPKLDSEGRLICPPRVSARPPSIATALTIKAVEYRIWHTRQGRAAFLSQLELQAILERALRRAAIPMTFSQGFHPLPLLSFGRALPVGVASKAEWFALTLRQALSADTVSQRLRPHLPQGMDILCTVPCTKGQRTAQSVRECFILHHKGSKEMQEEALHLWQMFAQASSMPWTRETKKGPRTADLRTMVAHLDLQNTDYILLTMDWEKSYISPLTLVLAVLGKEHLMHIYLEKQSQIFADNSIYPSPTSIKA